MKLRLLFFFITASFVAQGQTWLGTVNTDWNTPGNWQGGAVPATNTTALFDGTSVNNCVISGTIAVGGIEMAAGYTGTVSIAAGSSITMTGSGFLQAAGTFNCGSGALTVGNTSNFTCTGGTFIASSNTITLGNNVNIQRSFQHNNGTMLLNSSSGTTTFSVNGSTVDTATLYNLTLNMGGANNSYTVAANNKIIVANDLHIMQGCLQGAIVGPDTSGVMLEGNFICDQVGTNNNLASTIDIVFGGSANTTITMAAGGEGLFNGRMMIRKNSAANTVTLNSGLILNVANNQVNFTKGKLVTSSGNILTIGINGINLINASDSSFVDGPMNKIGGGTPDNAFVFPIGDNGVYGPIIISGSATSLTDYTASSTHTFQAEYFRADPDPVYSTASRDVTLADIGRCEYWRLDNIAGLNGNATPYVWLSYDSARSCGISDPTLLRVAKWDTSVILSPKWINLGGSAPVVQNGVAYLPSSAAVTTFSPFNLASTDAIVNPLPVTLTGFNGNISGNDALLYWTTASEINISSFTVERSVDGVLFKALTDIKAGNTAGSLRDYQYNDVSLAAGRYYYRLRINGLNDDLSYSKVVALEVKMAPGSISVYPNPVSKGGFVSFSVPGMKAGDAIATLTGLDGRILVKQTVLFNDAGTASFHLEQNAVPGICFLTVTVDGITYRRKLYIQ